MEYTCDDCGRVTRCWCGRCHYCEDVTAEYPEPLDEGDDDG